MISCHQPLYGLVAMTDEFLVILAGLAAGWFGGLLGVGGSIVMIPALTEIYGPDQHLYQAAAMIVNFFVVVPAIFRHAKARAILRGVILWTIPGGAVAVALGVAASELDIFRRGNSCFLMGAFGLFLFYIAYYNLGKLISRKSLPDMTEQQARAVPRWKLVLLVGLPAGAIGGLLGIGGGAVAVPTQQRFLKVPLRRAIANSACTIVCISVIGATFKNYELVTSHHRPLFDSIRLVLLLFPPAIIGSLIGSTMTHTLPIKAIRVAFIVLMLAAGGRLCMRAYADYNRTSSAEAQQSATFAPEPPLRGAPATDLG